MKALLLFLALSAATMSYSAEPDPADKAERARIAAERSKADARLVEQEAACYKKFAVNDCLKAARSERRERVTELRRQELALNEAQRKLRTQERLRGIEQKDSAQEQAQAQEKRDKAMARQAQKEEEVAKRAAQRAARSAEPAASRAAPKPHAPQNTAQALQESEKRQQDAIQRQERVTKRQAEKPAAKPLPVPP